MREVKHKTSRWKKLLPPMQLATRCPARSDSDGFYYFPLMFARRLVEQANKLGFAALDVYEQEPYSGKLLELDNVLCTPHVGSYAREARVEMEKEAVRNLLIGLGLQK